MSNKTSVKVTLLRSRWELHSIFNWWWKYDIDWAIWQDVHRHREADMEWCESSWWGKRCLKQMIWCRKCKRGYWKMLLDSFVVGFRFFGIPKVEWAEVLEILNEIKSSSIPARACFVVPDIDVLLRLSTSVGSTTFDVAIGWSCFEVPGIFMVIHSWWCEAGTSTSDSELEPSWISSISDDDGWCDFLYSLCCFGLSH